MSASADGQANGEEGGSKTFVKNTTEPKEDISRPVQSNHNKQSFISHVLNEADRYYDVHVTVQYAL